MFQRALLRIRLLVENLTKSQPNIWFLQVDSGCAGWVTTSSCQKGKQSARTMRDKAVSLKLNNIIIITPNLPSCHDVSWFVCVCARRINLAAQNTTLTILNALPPACAESSIGSTQIGFVMALGGVL